MATKSVQRKSTLKIDGLELLDKKMYEMDETLKSVLAKAAKAGADIIRDEAKRLAPVGKTGNLKRAIISQITWEKT